MKSLTLKSYAKVNLALQINHKRSDGFHDLTTIFQRISLHDVIKLTVNTTGKISVLCNHPHVPTGKKNLVYKVAELLKSKYGVDLGVHIDIEKKIPVAAGLAGGSTNAATVISGLNRLWNLNLPLKEQVKIAANIGSDVAFFLYDTSWAVGTGRGEVIKPLNTHTKLWMVLIIPKYKIYAKDVYTSLKLKLTKQNDGVNILTSYLRKRAFAELGSCIFNDLEAPILTIRPSLAKLKNALKKQNVVGSIISGSGPAVFAITHSKAQALKLQQRFSSQYKQVFAVQTA